MQLTLNLSMSDFVPDISNDQHAVRRRKLDDMRAGGFDPFRANIAPTHFSADAKALYVEGQDNVFAVTVAGRLVTFRVQGGSSFVKIQDQQGQIQLYFRKDVLGEERYLFFKKQLDLGDIIGVSGTLFMTKTGEITVRVDAFTLVSKALRPLPEKWSGLTDAEQIYRQRYLDLIVNTESRHRLMTRARIVSAVRRFWRTASSSKLRRLCCKAWRAARRLDPSKLTTTPSIPISYCASRWSFTSSVCSLAVTTGSSRSDAISATRAYPGGTIQSSPCSRSIRPTVTTVV